MNYSKQVVLLLLCQIWLITSFAQTPSWKIVPGILKTRWADSVSPNKTHNSYPRPQLKRQSWTNLNGLWDFKITDRSTSNVEFDSKKILVPYPIESRLSGVGKVLRPDQYLWYRRYISTPSAKSGDRIILHFGAVDYQATIYINGEQIGSHVGGYTAFSFDVTEKLRSGQNELMVRVFDPSDKGVGPHGKQVLNPESIYYTPSSGIWQTVWMETVPAQYIESLTITPDIDKAVVNVTVHSSSNAKVVLAVEGKSFKGESNSVITIPIKNMKLWSPDDPFLYDLTATLNNDKVKSYFGMRKISVAKDSAGIDRIMLNNKYTFNLGTLDQGFWPDGLYTAPSDEALAFDIKAIKAMGFNTIRKHIKVEPARWYYHADKLGMMVWQDMVNPNQGLPEGSKEAFGTQSAEIVRQLHNYPSITTWVLFNEKWGQYDQERLTKWLKTADPSRIVNGHSGEYLYVNKELRSPSPNAYVGADMTDVHAYPNPMLSIKQEGKAQVCGEFGGIGVPVPGHQWTDLTGWGYVQVLPKELDSKYAGMVEELKVFERQGLSASIYTQPFDVEGEENGLMTYDREIIKIPIQRLRQIHSGLINLNTEGFRLDPKFNIGKEIDQKDTDEKYAEFIAEFYKGKRDSAFLRRLVLMSLRKKDIAHTQEIADAYFKDLKSSLSSDNLSILQKTTFSTSSFAFEQLKVAYDRESDSSRKNQIRQMLKSVVDNEQRGVVFNKFHKPNLDSVRLASIRVAGSIGEETALENIALYHYLHKDLPAFVATKGEILKKYPEVLSNVTLANDSWFVFENATGRNELQKALEWIKRILPEEPNNANVIDTYANLLYKLGDRTNALIWEKKATELDPEHPEIKAAYEKMLKGLPTWPQEKKN